MRWIRGVGLATAMALALPLGAQVPRPEDVLGFRVGADGRLADYAQIVAYFERLARATPWVHLDTVGRSVQGRPMLLAIVTDPANQARRAAIQRLQAKLADPRRLTPAEYAEALRRQPAIVYIGASLHGNEIMATQMVMELAYRLVTEPDLRAALRDVIVLLMPSQNPDGLDITRAWWLRTRGTPYRSAPMPWLYHVYTGHDNNRDFFMVTQPETRAVTDVLYRQWFPQVVWDVHQMGNRGARYFIPPFADPLNPNIDPLLVRLTNLVGAHMAWALEEAGKAGVVHAQTFDLWWHGGARTVPARHNMVGILSEAASALYGDPVDLPPDSLRLPETGSMHPNPWRGGWWRPRDIVDYELLSAEALVRLLARHRVEFLRDFVALGRRQVERGRTEAPFAYVVPVDQRDPTAAADMLQVLRRGAVEVHRATRPLRVGGRVVPAGSWVVLLAQPYRAHAKDLLEVQRYPDRRLYPGGPPLPPYDLSGWTLPLQMGVEVLAATAPIDTSGLERVDSVAPPPASVQGRGAAYALDPRRNASWRAVFEVLRAGGQVSFQAEPLSLAGATWPAGAPVVWGVPDLEARVQRWARTLGVAAAAVPTPPRGVRGLRVGLYKGWAASIDEGWTRWLFEQWGVPFDTLHDRDVRGGDLARYAAIVVPAIPYGTLVRGPRGAHPDFAGGLGPEGVTALRRYVENGGTLLLFDAAVELAIRDFGVPVRRIEPAGPDTARFYAPGSLLAVRWDPRHPLAAGLPDEGAVFVDNSPILEVEPTATGVSVAGRYPERGVLRSGYLQGEAQIAGRPVLVVAPLGRGRVVLYAFRPQHRAQTHATFRTIFRAFFLGAEEAR